MKKTILSLVMALVVLSTYADIRVKPSLPHHEHVDLPSFEYVWRAYLSPSYTYDGSLAPVQVWHMAERDNDGRVTTEDYYSSGNGSIDLNDWTLHPITYTYDEQGRVIEKMITNEKKSFYTYDDAGNFVEYRSQQWDRTYNRFTYSYMEAFEYNALGQRTRLISRQLSASGAMANTPNCIIDFTYNDAGQMISMLYQDRSGNQAMARFDYTYDAAGNMIKEEFYGIGADSVTVTGDVNTTHYTYNEHGDLLTEQHANWTYFYSYIYDEQGRVLVYTVKSSDDSSPWGNAYYYSDDFDPFHLPMDVEQNASHDNASIRLQNGRLTIIRGGHAFGIDGKQIR